MKINFFHIGAIMILNNENYRLFRIIENNQYVLEKISDLSLMQKTHDDLLNLYREGHLIFSDNNSHYVTFKKIHSDDNVIFHEYFPYILAAQKALGTKPTIKRLQEIIDLESMKSEKKHKKPSAITIYRWWSKWVNSNFDSNVFQNKKRGPAISTSFNHAFVNNLFNEVIETIYLTRQKNSIQKAFDTFRYLILENNKKLSVPIKCPSRTQFYEKINRLDKETVTSARQGKRVARQLFRQTGKGFSTNNILERVEVDHTILDIMVFNENTGQVDGRPTLTALIDVHSRMILGIEIGFEPPSQLSVMRALKNAILPKDIRFEEDQSINHQWPAYGIPITLVCDNGMEFHARDLRRMCAELNI